MEILTLEKVRETGLPAGVHVLELVSDRAECAMHTHFSGMECVPVRDIAMVRNRFRPEEPIIIHCDRKERCTLAGAELDRFGYRRVFRFEGDLNELATQVVEKVPEPVAPAVSRDELESLLRDRSAKVHLLNLVADPARCQRTAGVRCLEPAELEEVLSDIGRGHRIVMSCEFGIDCQTMALVAKEAGFEDVRIFHGDYSSLSWLSRM